MHAPHHASRHSLAGLLTSYGSWHTKSDVTPAAAPGRRQAGGRQAGSTGKSVPLYCRANTVTCELVPGSPSYMLRKRAQQLRTLTDKQGECMRRRQSRLVWQDQSYLGVPVPASATYLPPEGHECTKRHLQHIRSTRCTLQLGHTPCEERGCALASGLLAQPNRPATSPPMYAQCIELPGSHSQLTERRDLLCCATGVGGGA